MQEFPRNHRRKKRTKIFLYSFLAFLLVAVNLCSQTLVVYGAPTQEDYDAEAEARKLLPIQSNSIRNWPEGPQIGAEAAILMEAETGTILYAKNIHEQLYPASTTKIMTCLLAAENCKWDDEVTFSYEAVMSVPSDGSSAGIDAGQKLSVEDCLKCILVVSANEVANGIAEHIGGSEAGFIQMMNDRAEELGCLNTHFVNASGLHDDSHFTSAYDLALITREFFRNEMLAKIAGTKQVHLEPTANQPDEIWANTKNKIIKGEIEYEPYIGGKTGYTSLSRQTLVSCAEKNGMRLICVILKEETPNQYTDTVTLFDYGFQNFEKINISEYETKYSISNESFFSTNIDIFGNSKPILSLNKEDVLILPVTASFEDTTAELSYEVDDPAKFASLSYFYQNVPIGTTSIDFVTSTKNNYSFDSQLVSDLETYTTNQSEEGQIIFVNVKKLLYAVVIIATLISFLIILHTILDNFNFGSRSRRSRRRRGRKQRYHSRYDKVDF